MKKFSFYLAILAVLPLLFLGCGTFCGEDPEGITGGGNGYGIIDPANSYGGGSGGSGSLYGTWRHDFDPGEYEILYLMENGNIYIYQYVDFSLDDYLYGTYTFSSSEITVTLHGEDPESHSYYLNGDFLTVYYGGSPRDYYRTDTAR